MADLATAKRIIDEIIAKHNTDVDVVFSAAQTKPPEQRMGFIIEALDEAQRGADADATVCDEIISAASTLKSIAEHKTAAMKDALNDIVFQRCLDIEREYTATVGSGGLTLRSSG